MRYMSSLWITIILTVGLTSHAQVQLSTQNRMPSPYQKLESKALLATVEQPVTVNDLAHEVVNYPHVYRIPPPLDNIVEADLARAEMAYRYGSGPGVSETQMLDLVTLLAARFRVPAYAKTTLAQIRGLRMRLAVKLPAFMGKGLAMPGMKVGDSIQTVMSPLQAMHLLGVLIDQKILNSDYQDPSLDLDLQDRERRKKIEELKNSENIQGTHVLMSSSNPKHSEMLNAISSGVQSMSMKEAYDLFDQILTTMRFK